MLKNQIHVRLQEPITHRLLTSFLHFLERKRKERKKLYLLRVNYIITGNTVVNITALKTLKESLKKIHNTTIWSSGANCTEIQQTLNEDLSKANSWFSYICVLKGTLVLIVAPRVQGICQNSSALYPGGLDEVWMGIWTNPPRGSCWLMHYVDVNMMRISISCVF